MVSQDLMVQPDTILAPVNVVQFVFSSDARGFLVPRPLADLAQVLALNSLKHPVVLLFLRKEKVLEDLVDVLTNRFLQGSTCKLHNHPVYKCPQDVLNKKVVCMPSRKVDVKAECQ